jgi:hypothetical protein
MARECRFHCVFWCTKSGNARKRINDSVFTTIFTCTVSSNSLTARGWLKYGTFYELYSLNRVRCYKKHHLRFDFGRIFRKITTAYHTLKNKFITEPWNFSTFAPNDFKFGRPQKVSPFLFETLLGSADDREFRNIERNLLGSSVEISLPRSDKMIRKRSYTKKIRS